MTMVTLKEIAEVAGVSEATVSRSLNGNTMISQKTRQRIQGIADRLGYSKNAVACGLSTGSSSVIGLIVADITNPYYAQLAHGIGHIARRYGFGVILCNTEYNPENEAYYARFLWSHRVSGIILASSISHEPVLGRIRQKFPVVMLSRMLNKVEGSYVVCDNVAGGQMAVNHLVKQGHQRIAYIGGPFSYTTNQLRFQGYRQALKANELPRSKSLCHFGKFDIETGKRFTKVLLQQKNRPTAVFAANDLIALGVMRAVEEEGLTVPADLAVVGYDNISISLPIPGDYENTSIASLPQIQLTTIAQPLRRMGEHAIEILLDTIKNPDVPPIQKTLPPKLIVRHSCGAKRQLFASLFT